MAIDVCSRERLTGHPSIASCVAQFLSLLTVSCVATVTLVGALDIRIHSLQGTEFSPFALTDKQLGILRYFAQQTFLHNDTVSPWSGWWVDPNQDSNAALRYQIAAIAYAAFVSAQQTPAYAHTATRVMKNCVERLIESTVWAYIAEFDDFVVQPTFPDPVAYKNIMYSGHLALSLALYEDLSGDVSFRERGWNFTWWNATQFPDPIPYNTSKLMHAIRQQMRSYFFGGVPCEPESIFVICNNYPHNAFHIYDRLYETNFSQETDAIWQEAVEQHALTGSPEIGTGQFFNLVFIMFLQFWDTLASEGSDAWALSWMRTWWNESHSRVILPTAFQHMTNSTRWANDSCSVDGVKPPLVPVCEVLQPNPLGNDIFPFPADITTSFFPLIAAQYNETSLSRQRAVSSVAYFEALGATVEDYDGDGVADAFHYNITEAYADWSTANLLTAFTLPSQDPDALRRLFRVDATPTYRQRLSGRWLEQVEYPAVHVASCESFAQNRSLHFVVVRGDGPFAVRNETTFLIGGMQTAPPLVPNVFCRGTLFLGPVTWTEVDGKRFLKIQSPTLSHEDGKIAWEVLDR